MGTRGGSWGGASYKLGRDVRMWIRNYQGDRTMVSVAQSSFSRAFVRERKERHKSSRTRSFLHSPRRPDDWPERFPLTTWPSPENFAYISTITHCLSCFLPSASQHWIACSSNECWIHPFSLPSLTLRVLRLKYGNGCWNHSPPSSHSHTRAQKAWIEDEETHCHFPIKQPQPESGSAQTPGEWRGSHHPQS